MDLNKLMQQAQQMQAGMAKKQEELEAQSVIGTAAGGKVTITATGAGEITAVKIDPSIVDPEDVEFLQDLIVQASQDAIGKANALTQKEMGGLTGGLGNLFG